MLQTQPLPQYRDREQPTPRRRAALSPVQRRRMEGAGLWLAVLMLLLVQPLFVEASEPQVAAGAGQFHFVGGPSRSPATVLETEYRVSVTGLVAETRLRQRFANGSDQWQEGVYTFPLPDAATVYALTMTTGERTIAGEVREREQARQAYQQARSEGRQAARLDQQRPNLFTTHLANIPPGEAITVELHYQQLVEYDQGAFSLRLPTTLTPRYIPGQPAATEATRWTGGWARPTSEVGDAHRITPPQVGRHGVSAGSHQASISVDLQPGLAVGRIRSASHRVSESRDGESIRVVPDHGRVMMDRDFLLSWQPLRGEEPTAAVFHQRWQGEDYLLAMLVPGDTGGQVLSRELVLVIDTSGSMAGESIRQAREALLRALSTLGPEDRFNVIEFNSHTNQLFSRPVVASSDNLARARRYVRGLAADGGTDMSPALEAALTSPDGGRVTDLRQVVFVTDGAVGNEPALFHQIRDRVGDTRLFTVAIGSAPNMYFMRQAARFGRGTHTTISDRAEVSSQMDALFRKMQSPVLTDIRVDWPDGVQGSDRFPARVGDLFLGEPMTLLARGNGAGGSLSVSGLTPHGQRWQRSLALASAEPESGIHRLWARAKVDALLDRSFHGKVSEGIRQSIVDLGLQHDLVTRYTSFVAIDKTPARAVDENLQGAAVPSLVPAGSDLQSIGYPQTATPAALMILMGVIGLVVSAVGRIWSRRRFQLARSLQLPMGGC